MDHAETHADDGFSAEDSVRWIAVLALLVAIAAPFLMPAGHAEPAPAARLPADDELELHVVRLVKVGPQTVRVHLDGKDLGDLSTSGEGFSGWATPRLKNSARRIAHGRVEIRPDPGVPVELTSGVQRLLVSGGVLMPTIVAADLPEALDSE